MTNVHDFLTRELQLLEHRLRSAVTAGEKGPILSRCAVVRWLLQEHSREAMDADDFEQTLRDMATGRLPIDGIPGDNLSLAQDQGRDMLRRWQRQALEEDSD